MPPRWRVSAVDPAQRQVGERAHVEIDHREFFGAVECGRLAEQAEAGIVDDDGRLQPARRQSPRRAAPVPSGAPRSAGDHLRAAVTAAGDFGGERGQVAPRAAR